MSSMNASEHAEHTEQGDQRPRIAGSWALVGIPLAYGLYHAVKAAAQLFTG